MKHTSYNLGIHIEPLHIRRILFAIHKSLVLLQKQWLYGFGFFFLSNGCTDWRVPNYEGVSV